MSLAGKKILCVGGNGYVGNYLASRLVQSKATVQILSRSGPKSNYPQNFNIEWLIGDVFSSKKFQQQINNADVIIHTIGTLFDTSIMKNQQPGGPGTYQAMNRDSLRSILDTLKSKKQVIYLSAVGHPPFIPRYAHTKQQAQQLLLQSQHDAYIFKPGFVYNWEHRKWSIPLKYSIQLWNKVYPYINKLMYRGSYLEKFVSQFEQSEPTSLQKMGDSLVQIIKNGYSERILKNDSFNELSQKYRLSQIEHKQ